ncbi:MAG: MlaD family protein [Pseudomonadota bacterium]
MKGFSTEAKVGIFVLAAIIILMYMSFKIGGFELSKKEGYQVAALFENAGGLKKGVPVSIAGIEVGTIEDISLDGPQAMITMFIDRKVILPLDSRAMIRTSGVLGDKYIEIIPGDPELAAIPAGGRISQTVTPVDMDMVFGKVGEAASEIRNAAAILGNALEGRGPDADLKSIIANLGELSANLAALVRDNNEQLNRIVANLTIFSADLRDITSNNKGDIDAIVAGFRETSEKLTLTIASIQGIAERINRGEGTIGSLINDDKTAKTLNDTLASLKDISNKINKGQGTLGKLVNDDETIDGVNEAVSGIKDYLQKDKAFKVYVDYHGDWLIRHDEMKSTINLRIQPSPDKFYLVGLVSDPNGAYSKTERTQVVNGIPIKSVDEKWKKDAWKFNAQIARRWGDLTLRGGIIESSGGVGLDYTFFDDALRLTFEGFTGDLSHPAHLRAEAAYNIWKYFYVSGGWDDFISDQDRTSAYVGVGLKFNDDDLKYIMGSVPIPK